MAFNLKQNDTSPSLQTSLLDGDGLPVNITGYNSARFHMRDSEGTVVINEDVVVVDAAQGVVRYDWVAADTVTAGVFEAEIEITYADNNIETFPNLGYISVVITDDIA